MRQKKLNVQFNILCFYKIIGFFAKNLCKIRHLFSAAANNGNPPSSGCIGFQAAGDGLDGVCANFVGRKVFGEDGRQKSERDFGKETRQFDAF